MMRFLFPRRQEGYREHRCAYFAGELEGSRKQIQQNIQESAKTQAERALKVNEAIASTEMAQGPQSLVNRVQADFAGNQKKMQELPPPIRDTFEARIAGFIKDSYWRFDRNGNRVTEVSEFQAFEKNTFDTIRQIRQTYAPTDAEAADQKAKKDAQEKMRKAGQEAAEAGQKITEEDIKRAVLDESKLNTIEGFSDQVRAYGIQQAQFQKEGGALAGRIAEFKTAYDKFEEGKKEAGVCGGPVAIAASVAFPPAMPFVIAFAGRGSSFLGVEFRTDPETEVMRKKLAEIKADVDEKKTELQRKKETLDLYGRTLEQAPDRLRGETEQLRDKELNANDQSNKQLADQQESGKKQSAEMRQQQNLLMEQRQSLVKYRQDLTTQQMQSQEAAGQVRVGRDRLTQTQGVINASLSQINAALQRTDIGPDQRVQLEQRQQELMGHKTKVDAGLMQMDQAPGAVQEANNRLQTAVAQADESFFQIDGQTQFIGEVLTTIEASLKHIEGVRAEIGTTQRETIQKNFMARIEGFNKVQESMSQSVLESGLANAQLMHSLNESHDWLKKVEINPPGVWDSNPMAWSLGKVAEGIQWVSKWTFEKGIFAGTSWLKEQADKYLPWGLNHLVKTAINITIDLPAGLLEAAVGLVGGIGHIIAHPMDALKGLGALIGRDPETGKWYWPWQSKELEEIDPATGKKKTENLWGKSWGALIGWEHLSKGEIGRGVGHAALNVLLTCTGVGAVGTGASVCARAAGMAGRIAQTTSMLGRAGLYAQAIVRNPVIFARVFATEIATTTVPNATHLIVSIAKAPGYVLQRLWNLGRGGVSTEAALTAEIASLEGRMGRLAGGKQMVNGRSLADVGLTLEDVAKMSPEVLESVFGVSKNNIKGLYELVKLEKTGAEFSRIGLARRAAQAEMAGEGLGKMVYLHGDALQEFVAGYNSELRTMTAAEQGALIGKAKGLRGPELSKFIAEYNPRSRAHQIVHAGQGEVVVFDAQGQLKVIKIRGTDGKVLVSGSAEFSEFIEQTAAATNRSADVVRVEFAQQILGRTLSTEEAAALIRAHHKHGIIGEMDTGRKVVKLREITRGFQQRYIEMGYTPKQARAIAMREAELLTDYGVAGKNARLAKPLEVQAAREVMDRGMMRKPKKVVNLDHASDFRLDAIVKQGRRNKTSLSNHERALYEGAEREIARRARANPEGAAAGGANPAPARPSATPELGAPGRPNATPRRRANNNANSVVEEPLQMKQRPVNEEPVLQMKQRPGTQSSGVAEPTRPPLRRRPVDAEAPMDAARARAEADGVRWRERYDRTPVNKLEKHSERLRGDHQKLRELIEAEKDPVIKQQLSKKLERLGRQWEQAEASLALKRANKDKGIFSKFSETPERAPIQMESEVPKWHFWDKRSRNRIPEAGWECLGKNRNGDLLVGKRVNGVYKTEIIEAAKNPHMYVEMPIYKEVRAMKPAELRAQGMDLARRRNKLTKAEVDRLDCIQAEYNFRLESGDPDLLAVLRAEEKAAAAKAKPIATAAEGSTTTTTATTTAGKEAAVATADVAKGPGWLGSSWGKTAESFWGTWQEGGYLVLPKMVANSGFRLVGELTGVNALARYMFPPQSLKLMQNIRGMNARYRQLVQEGRAAEAMELRAQIDAAKIELRGMRPRGGTPERQAARQRYLNDRNRMNGSRPENSTAPGNAQPLAAPEGAAVVEAPAAQLTPRQVVELELAQARRYRGSNIIENQQRIANLERRLEQLRASEATAPAGTSAVVNTAPGAAVLEPLPTRLAGTAGESGLTARQLQLLESRGSRPVSYRNPSTGEIEQLIFRGVDARTGRLLFQQMGSDTMVSLSPNNLRLRPTPRPRPRSTPGPQNGGNRGGGQGGQPSGSGAGVDGTMAI